MAITAAQVKELREKTGVGMMECKKALTETGGDLEKAIVYLREKGMSRAAKKAGRVAAEGLVEVAVNEDLSAGVLVEVNCETDFVTKNEQFRSFAKDVAKLALEKKAGSVDELSGLEMADGTTVGKTLTNLIATIGENMTLRRVAVLGVDNGAVVGYSHMGGKIGALVAVSGPSGNEVSVLGKDLAMHVAAAAPRYLKSDEVDASELEQERAIAKKKLIEEGKPENMIDKILTGQMNKFFKEVCLLEQAFVKDPSTSVKKHVEKSVNGAAIAGFSRFQLGEGIEKKQENFAEEVAAQLK